MSEDYVVQQGECISSIAYEHGFFWETIWSESKNTDLKNLRKNPNILQQGDVVFIPDLNLKQEPCASENKYKFVKKGVPAKLRLRMRLDGEARKNEEYRLYVDDVLIRKDKTDGDGLIECRINPNSMEAKLVLGAEEEEYYFLLGHLDPIDTIAGVQQRLNNLGLSCGETDGILGPKTKAAVEFFQKAHGLEVDGQPGQETQSKLKEIYGT